MTSWLVTPVGVRWVPDWKVISPVAGVLQWCTAGKRQGLVYCRVLCTAGPPHVQAATSLPPSALSMVKVLIYWVVACRPNGGDYGEDDGKGGAAHIVV